MRVNYRSYVARIVPRVLRSEPGKRFTGALALMWDYLAEGARQAVRSSWIGDRTGNGPAYDALDPGGQELSLPRYPLETWPQYHERLQRAWTDWPTAGHETSIQGQLAAAGFPNALIFYLTNWLEHTGWWSQFVVFFAAGTHPVTSAGPPIGSFVVGDGTTIGPVGITADQLFALRSIILKFKPAHWVCRAVIFEMSGWTVGMGHDVGEPGLVIGGVHVYVGVN
jgi:hypothetical protein